MKNLKENEVVSDVNELYMYLLYPLEKDELLHLNKL